MSGTITNTSPTNTNTFGCCAIIAQTRKGSVLIIGDSRALGTRDDNVANFGDLGEIEKSIGPTMACANYGISSLTAVGWNALHANQLALSAYFSGIVIQLGVNDLYGGASAATVKTSLQTLAANFNGKPVYGSTAPPETTSTDSWATTGNQSQVSSADNTQRIAHNANLRAGSITGFTGYFEVADQVESARDSGLWIPNFTEDGIHEIAAGTAAIKSSGAVNAAVFKR